MQRYKALIAVTLAAGAIVRLTEAQARPRSHVLAPVKDRKDCYEAKAAIQLKANEEFGYEGDLPKVLAHAVALPNGQTLAEQHAAKREAALKAERAATQP